MRILRAVLFITITLVSSLGASRSVPGDLELVWAPPPSPAARHETLAVHVTIDFDRSITSKIVQAVAKDEVAAIWKVYGVELLWSDAERRAALHLDVIVAPDDRGLEFARSRAELGRTTMDRSGTVCGPIRISSDAVTWLLRPRPGDPPLSEREFARAIGRVLAHEVGHVLLGACHDRVGLMRAAFNSDHLAREDRRSFQLTETTARTLRNRLARGFKAPSLHDDRPVTKDSTAG